MQRLSTSLSWLLCVTFCVDVSGHCNAGLACSRVMELLTQDWSLSSKLRLPAISRLQKVHNVDVALQVLRSRGVDLKDERGNRLTPRSRAPHRPTDRLTRRMSRLTLDCCFCSQAPTLSPKTLWTDTGRRRWASCGKSCLHSMCVPPV